jgi:hypothetical protein
MSAGFYPAPIEINVKYFRVIRLKAQAAADSARDKGN